MIILDYFLLNAPQFTTALYTGLFVVLSGILGVALRRRWIEGAAWGFLVLAGSADLAIFISRSLDLPTAIFGLLVAAICGAIIFLLRTVFFTAAATPEPTGKVYMAVIVGFCAVIWAGNILHPWPDSGFSSHHGWVPLYIQDSFSLGRFVSIEDTAFGEGLMTSLFYPADLLGLVALAGWLGADQVYPAFNAGSIAATLLMFALLSRSLKGNTVALAVFFLLSMVSFTVDPFFRTVLGGNWGDVLMYLGGALVCFYLSQGNRVERAFLLAAAASTFLVFGRHYGAFYSACIIAGGFGVSWGLLRQRSIRPWLVVGALWAAFSARELYYLLGRVTPYYPGSWQLERAPFSGHDLFFGALTDWGLIDASTLSVSGISMRSLYLVVLAAALWRLWPQIKAHKFQIIALLAPFAILLAPLLLQILTGYRTNMSYSKTYVVGIFFFSWYPAFLMSHLVSDQGLALRWPKIRMPVIAGLAVGGLLLGAALVKTVKPGRFIGNDLASSLDKLFEDNIVDREIVAALRRELSQEEMNDVVRRPVLYMYFEPGTTLRLYLGGDFFKDLDFWSARTGELGRDTASFGVLLEKLGYPNLYVGLMPAGQVPDFKIAERRKFFAEIENPGQAAWLDRIVQYGSARFYVVRHPGT